MYLPSEIEKITGNKPYTIDDIGQSGSKVLIFDDMVLKISNESDENDNELKLMKWLTNKVPAPEIICHINENELDYLLMSKISGKMCHFPYQSNS